MTPHDILCKHVFGHPQHAAGLLRHALPPGLTRAVAWATLRVEATALAGVDLQERRADLVLSAAWHGSARRVSFLVEHRSAARRWTALTMLGYAIRIHEDWRRTAPRSRTLPWVLPVVLHHGSRPWAAARGIAGLLDPSPLTPVEVGSAACLPLVGFHLDDLARCSEAQLRDRDMTALGRLALVCLQHVRGSDPDNASAILRRNLALVDDAVDEPGGQDGLQAVFSYFVQVASLPPQEIQTVLDEAQKPRVRKTFLSTADQLRAEGRDEGRVAAAAAILEKQLAARFGPLPTTALQKIQAASPDQVDCWLVRLVTAASLDEVLA